MIAMKESGKADTGRLLVQIRPQGLNKPSESRRFRFYNQVILQYNNKRCLMISSEDILQYGKALSVIRLNKADLKLFLNQGLMSTDYQGRKARNTSYDCVCFSAIPNGKTAKERLGKILQGYWNSYLTCMICPTEWQKELVLPQLEKEGVLLSAIVTDFSSIANCESVRSVIANSCFPENHYPTEIDGITGKGYWFSRKNESDSWNGEVRVYLNEPEFKPPNPKLKGLPKMHGKHGS